MSVSFHGCRSFYKEIQFDGLVNKKSDLQKGRLDFEIFKNIVEEVKKNTLLIIPYVNGEPFIYKHLDKILNLLKDLQEQLNLTILFISHDLPVVRQMCDRIAVLRNGELCEIALTEDLFVKPTHNYTQELLALMPKIESIYN